MQRIPACPTCSNVFTVKDPSRSHGSHMPLLLKCGHTCCEGCLVKLAKLNTALACPTCKVITQLNKDDDVKSLQTDAYVLGLLALSKRPSFELEQPKFTPAGMFNIMKRRIPSTSKDKTKQAAVLCSECEFHPATCRCLKCDCVMCGVCFDRVHQASNSLRRHQAVPVYESGLSDKDGTCPVHENKTIEYYCEDDQTAICAHCVIIGDHKDHNISSMEQKNKLVLMELEPAIATAQKVVRRLKKSDKVLNEGMSQTKTSVLRVIDDVRNHFQALHGVLQAREKLLIEELELAAGEQVGSLQEMKMKVVEEMKRIEFLVKDSHKVLNSTNHLIVNAKDLLDKLQATQNVGCCVEVDEDSHMDLRVQFDDSISEDIFKHGSVECTAKTRYLLHPLNSAPSSASDDDDDSISVVSNAESASAASQGDADVIIEGEYEESVSGASGPTDHSGSRPPSRPASVSSLDTDISSSRTEVVQRNKLRKQKVNFQRQELVYVTHIKHPCQFMIQRSGDVERLKSLSRAINRWCNSPNSEKIISIDKLEDELVLCQYSMDNSWYRGRVRNVNYDCDSPTVDVFYVDYGNLETVTLDKLRKMQTKFLKVPELAIQCSLVDIVPADKAENWSYEAIQSFATMTGDKQMHMSIVSHSDNVMMVDLSRPACDEIEDDRPASVRDALVFLELACFTTAESVYVESGPMKYPARQYLKPDLPERSDTETVLVCNIDSPDDFYIQMVGEEARYLTDMMNTLQRTYKEDRKDLWSIFCPMKNMVCVAQYSADNLWYRAEVIRLPGRRQVEIKYVDFGNTEMISHYKLKKILDMFLVLPAQAIQCRLADVEPVNPDKGWSIEAKALFKSAEFRQMGIVVKDIEDRCLVVQLVDTSTEEDICINAVLVEHGHARSTGEGSAMTPVLPSIAPTDLAVSPQSKPSQQVEIPDTTLVEEVSEKKLDEQVTPSDSGVVMISDSAENMKTSCDGNVELVEKRTSQGIKNVPNTEDIMLKGADKEEDSSVDTMVSLPDDNQNNKGAEMVNNAEKKTINLSEMLPKVPVTPHETKTQSVFPEKTSENVPENSAVIADASITKPATDSQLGKSTEHPKLKLRISEIQETKTVSDKNQKKEKVKDRGGKNAEEKPKKLKEKSSRIPVHVSFVESPSHLFVQLSNAGDDGLDRLMEDMMIAFKDSEPDMVAWDLGNVCAAKYSKNGRWYRAKVTEMKPNDMVEVLMLDYGFKDVVSVIDLRSMSDKFLSTRMYSICCHLADIGAAGDKTKWSRTACEYLIELVFEKECFLEKKGDVVDGSLPIDLVIEEIHEGDALTPSSKEIHFVSKELVDQGLALPVRVRNMSPRCPTSPITPPIKDVAPPDSPVHPGPLPKPQISKPVDPIELIKEPKKYMLPKVPGKTFTAIPTFVGHYGEIYAQDIKPDTHPEGRFGYILKESTLEVQIQDAYLQRLGKSRYMIPRDGNCLFRALAQGIFHEQNMHMKLREVIVDTLRTNWCLFQEVIFTEDKDTYLNNLAQEGAYGGEPEIQVVCYVYDIQISLICGGLLTPVQQHCYGNRTNNVIELLYVADGIYDCGHYDLVINGPEGNEGNEHYENWRRQKLEELEHTAEPRDMSVCDESILAQMMDVLQDQFGKSTPDGDVALEVGQDVVCQFAQDQFWYRGRVLQIREKDFEVQYVDFGNTEFVTRDQIRKDIILEDVPQQLQQCKLCGIVPATDNGRWTTEQIEFIHDSIVGKTCIFETKDENASYQNQQYIDVSVIMEDGRDFGELLVRLGLARKEEEVAPEDAGLPENPSLSEDVNLPEGASVTAATDKDQCQSQDAVEQYVSPYIDANLPGIDECFRVMVTQVDQPNQVYIQCVKIEGTDDPVIQDTNNQLDELTALLTDLNTKAAMYPPLEEVKEGVACCAQYTTDDGWYRAIILHIDPSGYVGVLYVDYGNSEYVPPDRLRCIPEEKLKLPAQATKCILNGVTPPDPGEGWSEQACHMIMQSVGSGELIAAIKDYGPPLMIELYDSVPIPGQPLPLAYQAVIDAATKDNDFTAELVNNPQDDDDDDDDGHDDDDESYHWRSHDGMSWADICDADEKYGCYLDRFVFNTEI